MRQRRIGLVGVALMALGLLLTPTSAPAEQVGQITALHAEARIVRIDGREYRLSPDADLGYEGQPGRLLALGQVKNGQPVIYETGVTDEGEQVVTRMLLLSE